MRKHIRENCVVSINNVGTPEVWIPDRKLRLASWQFKDLSELTKKTKAQI